MVTTHVMSMLTAVILRAAIIVHVTLDTLEMASTAQVKLLNRNILYIVSVNPLLDIDECMEAIPVCDENANCTDTEGSFQCTCNDGYTGNGTHCEGKIFYITIESICHIQKNKLLIFTLSITILADIDECFYNFPCDDNANCTNTDGSFLCECNNGYSGSGHVCSSEWDPLILSLQHTVFPDDQVFFSPTFAQTMMSVSSHPVEILQTVQILMVALSVTAVQDILEMDTTAQVWVILETNIE